MHKHIVAVYGSLRKGLHNHHLLKQADYLGMDYVPNFDMFSMGGFPYLKPSSTDKVTTIEVYSVTDSEFARLDCLEGYPHFYDRKKISTKYGDAWIYFIDNPNPSQLEVTSRDWKTYYLERHNDH